MVLANAIRVWLRRRPYWVQVAAPCALAGVYIAFAIVNREWWAIPVLVLGLLALLVYGRRRAIRG
jgi:hypothetical protein